VIVKEATLTSSNSPTIIRFTENKKIIFLYSQILILENSIEKKFINYLCTISYYFVQLNLYNLNYKNITFPLYLIKNILIIQ
jgi:hypothetical protein